MEKVRTALVTDDVDRCSEKLLVRRESHHQVQLMNGNEAITVRRTSRNLQSAGARLLISKSIQVLTWIEIVY